MDEETNDKGQSTVAEQIQQNSTSSRNSRQSRLDVRIIQHPRANTNKRVLPGCDNARYIKRKDSRPDVRNRSNDGDTIPGTSRSQPGCSKGYLFESQRVSALSLSFSDDGDGLDDIVTLQNNTCYMCNGFYAQNHGEAICSICHAFLFPHFAQDLPVKSLDEDSDSDSGNDEPQDLQLLLYSTKFLRGHRGRAFNIDAFKTTPMAIYEDTRNLACGTSISGLADLETLPTEVLLIIIQYLDEMSIWSLSQTNQRFNMVISRLIPTSKWMKYTLEKWKFLSRVGVRDWYYFYTRMMKSSFCFRCIKAMSDHELFIDEVNPWRDNRLRTESRSLHLDPLEGIWAIPLDRLKYHWQACIEGPAGSPYEGGKFYLYMQVPCTYPMTPPVVRFITKIFHPNVSRHGDIGIDSIQHNWSLALTVGKVLISIQSLLTDPYCEVCMEPEIGNLYLNNRAAFEEQASMWTWKYAMNELKY